MVELGNRRCYSTDCLKCVMTLKTSNYDNKSVMVTASDVVTDLYQGLVYLIRRDPNFAFGQKGKAVR